jgi:tetratricopeptide (TPR) repeat protein
MDSEHDNLRGALWYARELDDPRRELGLVAPLAAYWEVRGYLSEGLIRVSEALARDPEARAELIGAAARRGVLLAVRLDDTETGWSMVAEVNRLHRSTGDERWLAQALNMSGVVAEREERFAEARDFLERSKAIRERLGDEAGVCSSLHNLGLVAMDLGDYTRARAELGSALAIEEKNGWESEVANTACDLGFAELGDGRLDEARARFGEALDAAVRMGWKENVAYCLVGLGRVDLERDELERAAHLLGHVDRLEEDVQFHFGSYAERELAQLESGLRSRLDAKRFDALHAEGRSLSLEAAVSEAERALD